VVSQCDRSATPGLSLTAQTFYMPTACSTSTHMDTLVTHLELLSIVLRAGLS
jgi:hypothetical protein